MLLDDLACIQTFGCYHGIRNADGYISLAIDVAVQYGQVIVEYDA